VTHVLKCVENSHILHTLQASASHKVRDKDAVYGPTLDISLSLKIAEFLACAMEALLLQFPRKIF